MTGAGAILPMAPLGRIPAAIAGTPWGDGSVGLAFPPGAWIVRGLNDAQRSAVAARFGEVPEAGLESDTAEILLFRGDPSSFLPTPMFEMRFDVEAGPAEVGAAGPGWCARVELGPRPRAGLWLLDGSAAGLDGGLENVLRLVAAHRLLALGGLLVHSACVVSGGRAHLFVGHSGAGKTTLCRVSLAEGRTVLSDDLNALVRVDGRPFMSRVPFAGDLGGEALGPAGSFPLAGIYRLRKEPDLRLAPLSATEAVGLVAANAPFLNADRLRADALLDVAERLVDGVPRFTLAFPREGPVWARLERSLERAAKPEDRGGRRVE